MEQPLFSIAEEIPEQHYANLLNASLKEMLHDEPEFTEKIYAKVNGLTGKNKPYIVVKADSYNVCSIYYLKQNNSFRMSFSPRFDDYFPDNPIEHIYHKLGYIEESRISFATIEEIEKLSNVFIKIAFEIMVGESFGCCHLFNECSDARKCINPRRIMSLGCEYRKNLEKGMIFYGAHPTAGANYHGNSNE